MALDAQEPVRGPAAARGGAGSSLPRPSSLLQEATCLTAAHAHIDVAARVAEVLKAELAPACQRIEIAGSVRRRKPIVHDIELVLISHTVSRSEPVDLFQTRSWEELRIWDAVEELRLDGRAVPCITSSAEPVPLDPERWQEKKRDARLLKLLLLKPKLFAELYIVTPERWGALYTIRTGSREFSKRLVTHWTQLSGGGHVQEGRLTLPATLGGGPISTPREEDVFRACRLSWLDPQARQDALPVERIACGHRTYDNKCKTCCTWAETAWGIA